MEISAEVLGITAAVVSGVWLWHVTTIVGEPYLDEVFHVRQAQAYCDGQWAVWDPKITTPPGLYIVSVLVHFATRLRCNATFLRSINLLINCIGIPLVVGGILRILFNHDEGSRLKAEAGESRRDHRPEETGSPEPYVRHTSLNVSLFPLLFFFSALYYTDGISALSVLVSYWVFLQGNGQGNQLQEEHAGHGAWKSLAIIVSGLVSLTFRQTNIFWVSLFLAGLDVIRKVKALAHPKDRGKSQEIFRNNASPQEILLVSWRTCHVYDPCASDAALVDYIKTALSLACAGIRGWKVVLSVVYPYAALAAIFAAFVAWNGGVVLGDKSNHVATLHLPQMLYIWPYIVFFSWPLICQPVLETALLWISGAKAPNRWWSRKLPGALTTISVLLLMGLAVHLNTIVHPFTLADNRHYVFYVFRWILLRHRLAKYCCVPVYYLCASAGITALGQHVSQRSDQSPPPSSDAGSGRSTSHPASSLSRAPAAEHGYARSGELPPKALVVDGSRVSFVLVWLAATSLSLVTAPLVEPRYFIVPWLMWRLHLPPPPPPPVPLPSTSPPSTPPHLAASRPTLRDGLAALARTAASSQYQLWLETAWFLFVNLLTCYIFLFRGFTWAHQPHEIQRFMW